MRPKAIHTLLCVFTLALGCVPTGPIDVTIHPLGEESEPLGEEHILPIEFGLQGGFHVFIRLSLENLVPGEPERLEGLRQGNLPTARIVVEAPDGLINVPYDQTIVLERSGPGWVSEPLLVILTYYETPPDGGFDRELRQLEIEGFTVDVLVDVEDARGGQGQAHGRTYLDFP